MLAPRRQRFAIERSTHGGKLQTDAWQIHKAGFLFRRRSAARFARDDVGQTWRRCEIQPGDGVPPLGHTHAVRDGDVFVLCLLMHYHHVA